MAAIKSINVRIDSNLKEQSDKVLSDIGLTTSSVVSMLLRTIVRNRAVPPELFTLEDKAAENAAYLAKIERSLNEYKAGMGEKHDLLEVAE